MFNFYMVECFRACFGDCGYDRMLKWNGFYIFFITVIFLSWHLGIHNCIPSHSWWRQLAMATPTCSGSMTSCRARNPTRTRQLTRGRSLLSSSTRRNTTATNIPWLTTRYRSTRSIGSLCCYCWCWWSKAVGRPVEGVCTILRSSIKTSLQQTSHDSWQKYSLSRSVRSWCWCFDVVVGQTLL